jgi:hypothetical protein
VKRLGRDKIKELIGKPDPEFNSGKNAATKAV